MTFKELTGVGADRLFMVVIGCSSVVVHGGKGVQPAPDLSSFNGSKVHKGTMQCKVLYKIHFVEMMSGKNKEMSGGFGTNVD
jgi:hypothetical protein